MRLEYTNLPANFFERCDSVWGRWKFKRIIKKIRREFALFGFPVDDLTDDQILLRFQRVNKIMSQCGITAEQFNKNCKEAFDE